jgi:hypothetical protein
MKIFRRKIRKELNARENRVENFNASKEDTMYKAFMVLIVLCLAAGSAAAETYKWVDDKGTINFTEDYSKIPKKYRKKVKVKRDIGESTPEAATTAGEEVKKDRATKGGDGTKETAAGVKEEKKKNVYGGRTEDEWKADFRRLNDNINSVQAQIDERKARLNNPDNLSRGRYRGIEIEIKDLEEKMTQLQDRMSALDGTATKAGVPYEVRK